MPRIRVIDFETTGMEPPSAEVIEYGWCDLTNDGSGWTVGKPQAHLYSVASIPPETRAVHHIAMSDLAGVVTHFDEAEVHNPIEDVSVFAAHNLAFEDLFIPRRVLPGICTLKAALRVWAHAPSHSNSVLRYWLEDQGLLSLDHDTAMPPHRAGPDAYVTAHILKALLAAGATGREMIAWTQEPRLLPKITFGKHKGAAWKDAPRDYLEWVAFKSDLDGDTKWNAERELERRRSQ
ncbi:DNA polymerase III subunit epsilon [Brevundimonas naejangsanensis]|uniref:3'-5' exonuclease n=1 Tax=Brevundimonas naejangsanensis TaxID=588932 RepID=UPI00041AB7D4|nr:DNA polymerase III subunit epsilon [Brevundimonas naejangsanensis]